MADFASKWWNSAGCRTPTASAICRVVSRGIPGVRTAQTPHGGLASRGSTSRSDAPLRQARHGQRIVCGIPPPAGPSR